MLCSHCLEPAPGSHRGFPKGEGKGLQAGQEFLESWGCPPWIVPPRAALAAATREKRAFRASPGAMEGTHCSCPNQASLPNNAETGEAAGAAARFVCAGRIPSQQAQLMTQ